MAQYLAVVWPHKQVETHVIGVLSNLRVNIKNINVWGLLIILLIIGSLYLNNQVWTIYGGDSGDLVSAVLTRGVAHPPGYPLYTLLGVILVKIIPFGTAAWQVGFLSSIPAIFALLLLFDLLCFLTKKFLPSLISILVLALTYPFWLYSIVSEVFSLSNFFIISILWCFIHFAKRNKIFYFYLGNLLFGLSLTHHQIILFLLPSLVFLFWIYRHKISTKELFVGLILFLVGLLPYIYVFFSAYNNPLVNWLGSPTYINFFKLITREIYGTFRSGNYIGHDFTLRIISLWGFFNFAFKDFRLAGMSVFVLGVIHSFNQEKKVFAGLFIGFLSYLFFIFYASFPLAENFTVATFERFVLPLYIFISIFISYGLIYLLDLIKIFLNKLIQNFDQKFRRNIFSFVFFLYPLSLLIMNYPKLSILKNDFTAENFGHDLLDGLPKNSIILMAIDTPLFDSQYVYFSEQKWPNVKLLQFGKLFNPLYSSQIKKSYPDIIIPNQEQPLKQKFEEFVEKNYERYAIFSKQPFDSLLGVWIPWGLNYRFFYNKDIPKNDVILKENQRLWNSYHDPLSGSLAKYKNLILADVLRMYAIPHQDFGFWAAKNGYNDEAEIHLLAAERLYPDDLDSNTILAQVYIQKKQCDKADEQLEIMVKKDKEIANIYLLKSINYAICYKDQTKSSFYQNIYEEKRRNKETPLKQL